MKRIISVIIAILLLVSSALSVVASADDSKSYNEPLIVVRGMVFAGLTVDKGTENERNCIVTPDMSAVASLAFSLAKTYFSDKALDIDAVVSFVDTMLGSMACDENGNSLYNVTVDKYPEAVSNYPELYQNSDGGELGILASAVEYYGAEKVYYFTYDWRLDPSDIADELNEMIENAKAEHNSDKVDLVCCSMGGIVTDCYIYEYGCESLDSVVFNSSTFCGTHVTTELFQGKVLITADMLENLVSGMIDSEFFVKVLSATGIFDVIADFAMDIVAEYKDEIYNRILRGTFATMPVLWALVQSDEYDACVEYMFPTSELKSQYSGLIERTDALQNIMSGMDELLLSLPEKGVKVAVIAGYNSQMVPVYESAALQSDGTLESDLMLGRATVSETGKTLGDDYVGERVSPDKCVDLSQVLFPEYTWAIRDGAHIIGKAGTDSGDFLMTVLGSTTQPTVDSFPEYPQFMIADSSANLTHF